MLASAETTLLKNKGEFPLVENPSEKKITSVQPVKMQLRSPNDENEELSKYNMLDSFSSCILCTSVFEIQIHSNPQAKTLRACCPNYQTRSFKKLG